MRKIILITTLLVGITLLCACGSSKQEISDKKIQNPDEATTEDYFMSEAYWDEDAAWEDTEEEYDVWDDIPYMSVDVPDNLKPKDENTCWYNGKANDETTEDADTTYHLTDDSITINGVMSVTTVADYHMIYKGNQICKTFPVAADCKFYETGYEYYDELSRQDFEKHYIKDLFVVGMGYNILIYVEKGTVKKIIAVA